MDNLSYRNNRPVQRSSDPTPSTHAEAAGPAASHQPSAHSEPARNPRRSKQPSRLPGLLKYGLPLVVAALIAGFVAWKLFAGGGVASTIDSSKYQVVVLRDALNTPNYFGKLSVVDDKYMRLTNIYYLKQKADTDTTNKQAVEQQDASDFELIKLGGEIHGPQDEMVIPIEQILYFENLKPEGQVSKAIASQEKK